MKRLLLLFAVLLLTGCAGRWEHATKTDTDFDRDERECHAELGDPNVLWDPKMEQGSYENCMWARGWRKKSWFGN